MGTGRDMFMCVWMGKSFGTWGLWYTWEKGMEKTDFYFENI